MKKTNRTTLTEPPTLETGSALESKPSRGQHPNSRRKKGEGENEMVKITRFVFKSQAGVSGKELREILERFNIQDQNKKPEPP